MDEGELQPKLQPCGSGDLLSRHSALTTEQCEAKSLLAVVSFHFSGGFVGLAEFVTGSLTGTYGAHLT